MNMLQCKVELNKVTSDIRTGEKRADVNFCLAAFFLAIMPRQKLVLELQPWQLGRRVCVTGNWNASVARVCDHTALADRPMHGRKNLYRELQMETGFELQKL
jgi:hypothetical protein